MPQIICAWCQTANPPDATNCLACGAPLEPPPAQKPWVETVANPPADKAVPFTNFNNQDLKAAGEATEKFYLGTLGAYSLLWRTLGEAAAIAVTALMLGLTGAATQRVAPALVGAVLLGIVVGLVNKPFWLSIIGAPMGGLLGAALWAIPWGLGAGPGGMVYSLLVFALLGAWLGHRRRRGKNIYERVRPLLGALGGLFFVLLGVFIGLGLQGLINAIIQASASSLLSFFSRTF